MVAVARTFTVEKPVSTVFAYLSDFTSTEQWDPGTVETTRLAGDGGVGTRYRNVSRFLGRKVELTYETTQVEKDELFEVTGRNDAVTTKDRMVFVPIGDLTQISYAATFTFSGLLGKIPDRFLRAPLERLADKTVAMMRETLATI